MNNNTLLFKLQHKILICLLIVTGVTHALALGQVKKQEHTDSIEYYNKLVLQYRYKNPDSATFYANLGLAMARKQHNYAGEAKMLNQLGMIDDNVGDFESSRKKYLSAYSLYKKINDTKGMATENIRLGVVEMRKGVYDRSIDYFLQALQLSQRNGNKLGQMEGYITLGEAFAGQKKYDRAIEYYRIAEKLNQQIPFSNLSLNLYNDIAIAYRETGRLKEAIPYLVKGIQNSDVPQYQGLNITLINTLASVYAKAGDTTSSIKLQKSALEKAKKINNYIRQIQILTGLATTYQKSNLSQSLYYWQQAFTLSSSRKAYKEQIDELNAMADIYNKQKNYKAAYEARNKQYKIADEFFYKKMSKQIISLQNAYELNQYKVREQQFRFEENRRILRQRVSYGVIITVLIILGIVMFYYYRMRKLNLMLHHINDELQELNTVKDKLFSILGHDLRSPFVSVINMVEIIDDDELEPEQRKALLNQLQKTTKVSLETLDNLLRWGQKQIKGTPIHPSEFNARLVISKVTDFLLDVSANKHITIENQVNEHTDIYADADHFEFIIRNLVSNAIKFSNVNGKVVITAEQKNGEVAVTVRDNGVGIAPEKLADILDSTNVSTRGTSNEKGTGLGLLLCKEFAELNGGRITVESKVGEGSAFTVILKENKPF